MSRPAVLPALRLPNPGHAFVLIAAAAILSLGIVGFKIMAAGPTYKVATWSLPPGTAAMPKGRALTGVGGVLGGRSNADGTACFWLGNTGDQAALIWPPRFSAHASPLSIFNEKDHRVATVGQFVNLDGSVPAPEDVLAMAILGCPKLTSVLLVAG